MTSTLTLTETQLFALANAEPNAHVLITATESSTVIDGVLYIAPRSAS